jgi:uncharacterized RmlC-like cupin family protein
LIFTENIEMMFFQLVAIIFAISVHKGHAFKTHAGLCDTANAQSQLTASMMSNAIAGTPYQLTSNSKTYTPGQKITLTLTGAPFKGILVYVADSNNPAKRVGSFVVPADMQNNAAVCTNSETPNSSITHTINNDMDYPGSQTFTYTAPSAAGTGNLLVNFIIVQHDENANKNTHYIGRDEITITPAGGSAPAPFTNNINNYVPECGDTVPTYVPPPVSIVAPPVPTGNYLRSDSIRPFVVSFGLVAMAGIFFFLV